MSAASWVKLFFIGAILFCFIGIIYALSRSAEVTYEGDPGGNQDSHLPNLYGENEGTDLNSFSQQRPTGSSTQGALLSGVGTSCSIYLPGDSVLPQYAVPYDLFTPSKKLILAALCSNDSVEAVAGGENQYVYGIGHAYVNGSWQKITYQGAEPYVQNWYKGIARAQLPPDTVWFTAYICTWSNTTGTPSWRCGCRDSACRDGLWSIQGVQ